MIRLQVLYPPSLSPPPPSFLLLAPPFCSSYRPPFVVHGALWRLLWLCWCQHWGIPRRPRDPQGQPLNICLRVCLYFWPRCPLMHLTHSSLLCSRHLKSSPNTAGLWWTLFLRDRVGLAVPRRAKWVRTVWEASAQTHRPPPIACTVKQPWGSFLWDHRGY